MARPVGAPRYVANPPRFLLLAVIEQAKSYALGDNIVSSGLGAGSDRRAYRARAQAEARAWLRTPTAAHIADLAGVDVADVLAQIEAAEREATS